MKEEMKSKDVLRKYLIRTSIIVLASLTLNVICLVFAFMSMNKAIDESRKYLYWIRTDGEIVPLEWINRRDNIAAEMSHHLMIFVENFYSLNQFNWEHKVEKALWLGDLEQLHFRRDKDGYYNQIIQYGYSYVATLYPENIELSFEEGRTVFRIIINLNEIIDKKIYQYSILARGEIEMSERNLKHNGHGMFIKNYVEERVIKEE